MYNFTERDVGTILGVFDSLMRKSDRELNTFLGSITIQEMKSLYYRLHYAPYCEKYGVRYEDMDEDDFIRAYEEEWAEKNAQAEDDGWDTWEDEDYY